MNDRQNRILIPSAIALFSMVMTLWASTGFANSPLRWFHFISNVQANEIKLILNILLAFGVSNIGIGSICYAATTLLFMIFPKIRITDLDELTKAFGFSQTELKSHELNSKLNMISRFKLERKKRKWLIRMLLAEFHLRFHSHAPQALIDHCSRRNSSWYISLNNAFASIFAWLFALLIMLNYYGGLSSLLDLLCRTQRTGLLVSLLVFLVVLPIILFIQGCKWNKEFWDVCWKWIYWDIKTNPGPENMDLWHNQIVEKWKELAKIAP